MNINLFTKKNRGFTIFFAVLVSSLALSVGLAIYSLLVRELALSQIATQSQYAIYAADTGVECALYWDSKYKGTKSIFSAPPGVVGLGANIAFCNGQDILASWSQSSTTLPDTTLTVTTTFTIALPTGCATVVVTKTGNSAATTIKSRGFNTCSSSAARVERALQVDF